MPVDDRDDREVATVDLDVEVIEAFRLRYGQNWREEMERILTEYALKLDEGDHGE